jgi:hypothetical protein
MNVKGAKQANTSGVAQSKVFMSTTEAFGFATQ